MIIDFEEKFTIIGYPEIEHYINEDGFEQNSTLIEPNLFLGIRPGTYIISKDWLNKL